ncbi:MAG: hypothetical protein ACKVS9_19480 [Phycisphaerae bacterium]
MGRVAGFLITLAVFGGLAWYRMNARDAAFDEIDHQVEVCQDRIIAILKAEKGFDKYGEKALEACDTAHERAIDLSYTQGSRRVRPTFDPRKYATVFGEQIVNVGKLGRQDKDYDLFLRQFQVDIEAAVNTGKFDADKLDS